MILIIDDDKVLSMHAKIILEKTGRFDVKVVNSAIDGLEEIFMERPEAVLLDISMPVCDGITLLGMIRQSETLRDLPVVMYSSGMKYPLSTLIISSSFSAIISLIFLSE